MKKYQPKHLPGRHYHLAHLAISSKRGVIAVNAKGEIEGSGTIAESQVQELLDGKFEISEDNDFVLPYEKFEEVTDRYRELKDIYIDENNIEIQSL